ncbi:unnamed protein product [Polarella glacialis]|uniref:Uncharacterized protein n=2 Tax=Polarella glacialis TaxID=89957 RepID=A0A813LKE4_POLGL|nr:unnamed protein product [Polarella glacialis]
MVKLQVGFSWSQLLLVASTLALLSRPVHSSGSLDAGDWAEDLLAANSVASRKEAHEASTWRLVRSTKKEALQDRKELGVIGAASLRASLRSAAEAADSAAAAAESAMSLHQRAASWLRPGVLAAPASKPEDIVSLAAVEAEAEGASEAAAAVVAAQNAAAASRQAIALAAQAKRSQEESMRLRGVLHRADASAGILAFSATSAPPASTGGAPSGKDGSTSPNEAELQSEAAAAKVAGLCVLSICIFLCWFQTTLQPDIRRFRPRHEVEDEESPDDRVPGMFCCRTFACCGSCFLSVARWASSCSRSAILLMLSLFLMVGWSGKLMWDNHIIQKHLEEATFQLFLLTTIFLVVLVIVGEFIRWLKEKIGYVHHVVSFVDDKVDDITDFLGFEYHKEDDGHYQDHGEPGMPKDRLGKRVARERQIPVGFWNMFRPTGRSREPHYEKSFLKPPSADR